MTKSIYKVGDHSSSPYDPAMTDLVIYKTFAQGVASAEAFPAIVVKTLPDDFCDLTVFTNTGVRHIRRVKYSADPESSNCWHWPPKKEARTILKEVPVAEPVEDDKPIDTKTPDPQTV